MNMTAAKASLSLGYSARVARAASKSYASTTTKSLAAIVYRAPSIWASPARKVLASEGRICPDMPGRKLSRPASASKAWLWRPLGDSLAGGDREGEPRPPLWDWALGEEGPTRLGDDATRALIEPLDGRRGVRLSLASS